MPQRRVLRFEGWQTAGLNALTTEGYVQAKGRLQPWNSKGWRPEGLVEAAARDLEGFKTFKCVKPGKRMPQRRVLRVWRLANGRLERPNNRGLCAGKGLQPWNSKGWRPEGLVEAAARDLEGFKNLKCLKPGKRMPQRRVLRVWRLANGRLERPNNRGLCAGKGQAAALEQQRLTARGLGGSRAWWKPWTTWRPWPWQSRFHTSGGPRRRPCLGEGRGRRITLQQSNMAMWKIHHLYMIFPLKPPVYRGFSSPRLMASEGPTGPIGAGCTRCGWECATPGAALAGWGSRANRVAGCHGFQPCFQPWFLLCRFM